MPEPDPWIASQNLSPNHPILGTNKCYLELILLFSVLPNPLTNDHLVTTLIINVVAFNF
jgi:hypothetical protein